MVTGLTSRHSPVVGRNDSRARSRPQHHRHKQREWSRGLRAARAWGAPEHLPRWPVAGSGSGTGAQVTGQHAQDHLTRRSPGWFVRVNVESPVRASRAVSGLVVELEAGVFDLLVRVLDGFGKFHRRAGRNALVELRVAEHGS